MKKFSTQVLDRKIAERDKGRELRRKGFIDLVFSALAKLADDIFFEDAYLFGSITKEKSFREKSDVDIGFLGLKDKDVIRATALLSRELDVDVDVVQLEEYKLAEKIMREGIKWKKNK